MGKKRVIAKPVEETESQAGAEEKPREIKVGAKGITRGAAHIQATYNNTLITVTDERGETLAWASAGSLGFSGTKKATPYAAARVAETIAEKVKRIGIQSLLVRVSGVGFGRDSAIRSLANHGLNILSIKDVTPIPHNGPRPSKPRRV